MSVPRTVADVLEQSCDPGGRGHRPHVPQRLPADAADTTRVSPRSSASIAAALRLLGADGADEPAASWRSWSASSNSTQIPLVQFRKGQRKDDVMAEQLRTLRAAPKGWSSSARRRRRPPVFRTEKRRNPKTGQTYPWIVRSHGHGEPLLLLRLDHDFGPFFLKFCTYFPYNAKLCLNGHEYVKRQLAKEGIAFEALDNGILVLRRSAAAAADLRRPVGGQDRRAAAQVAGRLPHPFTAADRKAGYRYDISILQAEFSLDPGARPAACTAACSSRR